MPIDNTTDYRTYVTVFNSDNSLQYRATVLVCILATPISFLTFYLIWKKSKHERFSIKLWSSIYHLSFYGSQLQLGVFGGMVTLHPFPAAYCQGILRDYFDCFTLFMVWVLLFCTHGYSIFIIQLKRLQAVARPGKFFDCHKSTYYTFYVVIGLLVYVPTPSFMFLTISDLEEMEEFVKRKYPNNLKVLEYPGVYILTDSGNTTVMNFIMICSVIGIFMISCFLYISIYLETRVSRDNKNYKSIKERLKGIQNFVAQSILMGGFITISSCLIFKSFFNDPSTDSRMTNTIAYSCLCGASIPSQLLMISRNSAYRNFLLGRKKSVVIPEVSVHIHRRSIVANI